MKRMRKKEEKCGWTKQRHVKASILKGDEIKLPLCRAQDRRIIKCLKKESTELSKKYHSTSCLFLWLCQLINPYEVFKRCFSLHCNLKYECTIENSFVTLQFMRQRELQHEIWVYALKRLTLQNISYCSVH